MRKPAVVAIVVLLFLLTLARKLAQPAIADEAPERESGSVVASHGESAASANQTSVPLPAPIRPSIGVVNSENSSAPATQSVEPLKSPGSRKRALRASSRSTAAAPASAEEPVQAVSPARPSGYRALLGEPSPRIRRVMDHGAHGIGTPQWIESLSGPKTRVPVRDFSEDRALNKEPEVAPLAVPVHSNPRSAAESAH
jgi:hypothetical protein